MKSISTIAALVGVTLINTSWAQTIRSQQTWQDRNSGVVTWGAVMDRNITTKSEHQDVFLADGSLVRETYQLTDTVTTYRVRWQDQIWDVTRTVYTDGSHQDQRDLVYQKTAVRLHDVLEQSRDLRGTELIHLPKPQATHDPLDYQVKRYYFNNPDLGTPTANTNPDPQAWLTPESMNRANELVNANSAWSRGWTGLGSGILIMDTGIDLNHADFRGRVRSTLDLSRQGMQDRVGHGTHVAGVAAGARNGFGSHGVAFDSHLYIAKLADNNALTPRRAQEALIWAQQFPDIRAANFSANTQFNTTYTRAMRTVGSGVYVSGDRLYSGQTFYNRENPQDWARALAPGVVLTVSAGNQNLPYPQNPAAFAAATDAQGQLILRGQMLIVGNWNDRAGRIESARAGHVCRDMVTNQCRDPYRTWDFYILAPGMAVNSATPGGESRTMSGSSQAAPVVAGAAAIIGQMWPYMPADQVVQLLLRTARRDLPGYDVTTHGQGLLDLDQATRPLGHLGIRTRGRTTGRTPLTGSISVAGAMTPSSMAVLDDLDRDFVINMSGSTTVSQWHRALVHSSDSWVTNMARVPMHQQGGLSLGRDDHNMAMSLETTLASSWYMRTSLADLTTDPTVSFQGIWGRTVRSRMLGQDLGWRSGSWSAELGVIQSRVDFVPGLVERVSATTSVHGKVAWQNQGTRLETGMLPRARHGTLHFMVPQGMDHQGQMQYTGLASSIRDPLITYVSASHDFLRDHARNLAVRARLDSHDRYQVDLQGGITW